VLDVRLGVFCLMRQQWGNLPRFAASVLEFLGEPFDGGAHVLDVVVLAVLVADGAAGAADAEQVDRERVGLLERPPHRVVTGQDNLAMNAAAPAGGVLPGVDLQAVDRCSSPR
jgi:hypothetical protein